MASVRSPPVAERDGSEAIWDWRASSTGGVSMRRNVHTCRGNESCGAKYL
jgi:hypothetical protein